MSIRDPEARGTYINIVAGSLGFVGAGATTAVSQLVANGVNVGRVSENLALSVCYLLTVDCVDG